MTKLDQSVRERYSRQILFNDIGEDGQQRLLDSSVVVVGCGALGTVLANLLVRAGVGRLRIIDRDYVEASNLQRQTLFEETDARDALPKAVAAERRLRAINSGVHVEGVVAELSPANAEELLGGFPLLLDGTDNFETRLLVNDYAIRHGVAWIYAAVVASYGVTLAIRPGQTACLACLLESDGGPNNPEWNIGAAGGFGEMTAESGATSDGTSAGAAANSAISAGAAVSGAINNDATCDTIGVLGAAAGVIASLQAAAAIKILLGKTPPSDRLISCDVWTGRFQAISVQRRADCRACRRREFQYLDGRAQPHVTLCGRDSVQIHERRRKIDLLALGRSLAAGGNEVRHNEFLLRLRVPPHEVTVFADGRAIVKGTRDPSVARSLYARYIGA